MAKRHRYDVIFMDIEMPIRNGILTCQDILQYYAQNPHLNLFKKKHTPRFKIHHSRIQTNPSIQQIQPHSPIMVGLSSHCDPSITSRCWKAGFLYFSNLFHFLFL